jgi:hypothetical protein
MKLFIFALGLLLLSAPAFACQIQAPSSEVTRYIEAASMGQGVPPLYSCKDKPKEVCHCLDTVEDWTTMKLAAGASGEDVLVTDPDKVAVKKARERAEGIAESQKLQERKDAVDAIKEGCPAIDAASTIAQIKAALKPCILNLIKARSE